jgi:NAD(P)-dependent dehydrogenase (short-subunit alcohol dehydrogenase family)
MSLKDKVVIVTGGASGIGRATSKLFVQRGAKVVIADVNEEKATEVLRDIKGYVGESAFIQTDVSKYETVKALMEDVAKRFGRIDVMVNNAGVSYKPRPLHETSIDILDTILNVNLKGVFYGMKCVIPYMLKQGKGVIINVASALGTIGSPGLSCYCASKGGVIQLTKVAAIEYAKSGIRVVAVAPGPTETAMLEKMRGNPAGDEVTPKIPMGRIALPEEIASVIVFLASDEASYITGSVVLVEGGQTAI